MEVALKISESIYVRFSNQIAISYSSKVMTHKYLMK